MKSKELNIDMIGFTDASTLDNMQEYLEYRQNTKKGFTWTKDRAAS